MKKINPFCAVKFKLAIIRRSSVFYRKISAHKAQARPDKPVTQLRIEITRQTGETVLEGEAWCYTMQPAG